MDTKTMMIRIWTIMLLLWLHFYRSQEKIDTLQTWMGGFSKYHSLKVSENNRWVLVNKSYPNNSDTIVIYDTKVPGKAKGYLATPSSKQRFIGEKALLVQQEKTVEYIRLSDMKSFIYHDIKKMDVLADKKRYVLLDYENTLKVYDEGHRLLKEINNVNDYVTDEKGVLIAIIKEDKHNRLVNVMEENLNPLYTTIHTIIGTPKFPIKNYAAFTETDEASKKIRSVLINLTSNVAEVPLGDKFVASDFVQLTPIHNGNSFLIDFEKRIPTVKDPVVEVWYGNDQFLRDRKKGVRRSECLVWNATEKILSKLPSEEFSDYVSMNSERYFLAFNNAEQFDYRYSSQIFPLFLYDRQENRSVKICDATRDVVISSNSRYIVMLNELNQQWELFDVNTHQKYLLEGEMQNPSYSDDEHYLLFESNDGIKVYDLHRHQFSASFLPGMKTAILRKDFTRVYEKYSTSFVISEEQLSKGILIKAINTDENTTEYYQFNGKRVQPIFKRNENYIKEIVLSPNKNPQVITIEEFYNKKGEVFIYYKGNKSNKKYLSSTRQENEKLPIRREMINFTNSVGKKLKGALFYPIHFDPQKKYPLIVRIYQEQSSLSNKYLYPSYDGIGYNVRLLIEKGYFVFLPDTAVDERGSGVSALDCVNSGLDAIAHFTYIDTNKMGLLGHSFGGYETNYIATQSKRFKAYVSGAGIGDLISRYFTYNHNYGINEYGRIETGQFKMDVPFSEAKEKYLDNSPIYFAEKVSAPILLWSGLSDVNVPPTQSLAFYTALQRNKKDVIALFYNNQYHALGNNSKASADLNWRTLEWWDYFLKNKTDVLWINQQMKRVP